MNIYIFILSVLFVTALADLMVGVSNDAVNFLNSAIGSKAAKRRTILIIAGLGVLVGTTFSSGMMEVARKGIFNPEYFVMHEVIIIFLAVMLTDILLLDLYNTFGLPTSTTVSIVFEIFGGAVAIALLKIRAVGGPISDVLSYINTKNVITIISSIGLSVVFAFVFGSVIQYLTRLIFTFDYQKTFKRYGSIYCGFALTAITFFIVVKGAKGSSLIPTDTTKYIMSHSKQFILFSIIGWTIIWQLIITFTRVNVLKVIVLIGTFALALAFAANDLVNFIGAPLGALSAYKITASAGADPLQFTMEALRNPVKANTLILLFAGLVMVITLWRSKKAQSVTKTEVSLGRQDEGVERFESSLLARGIVRMSLSTLDIVQKITPKLIRQKVNRRIDPTRYKPVAHDGGDEAPAFDLLRAAVNLMVASMLVSIGTSFKLPLSTTFVTFMVAMATSLADKSWGTESAVYRVNGVLTVLGGWFFTAFMAFSSCFVFSIFIYYGKLPAILVLLAFGLFFLYRSGRTHKQREEKFSHMERAFAVSDDVDNVTCVTIRISNLVSVLAQTLDDSLRALLKSNRRQLKDAYKASAMILSESDVIIGEIFHSLRSAADDSKGAAPRYARTIGSLQLIAATINDLTHDSFKHISNNHKAPGEIQSAELAEIANSAHALLAKITGMLKNQDFAEIADAKNAFHELQDTIYMYDKHQMKRIKSGKNKSRQSLLFVSTLSRIRRISEQSLNLAILADESLKEMPA
ncbi:inorganic phosphate transporter [candidate division KSB1 bacterium]|nr:inorganic phosphate transporter [candidate division KSB1 bacterium]